MNRLTVIVVITVLLVMVLIQTLYCYQLHDELIQERLQHKRLETRIVDIEDWNWRMRDNLRCLTSELVTLREYYLKKIEADHDRSDNGR